jgi:hypothetical protein
MPEPLRRAPRPSTLERLRRDLRAQGVAPDSATGKWLLRLLSRGERATSDPERKQEVK